MSFAKIAARSAALSGALVALSAHYAAAAPALATTNVNLRQGPGTTYTVVLTIPGGSTVDGRTASSPWKDARVERLRVVRIGVWNPW